MVLEKSQIAEELFVWPLPEISISAKLSSLGASKLVYTICVSHKTYHCCGQVILQACKMNYVKLQILYGIFLYAKHRILQEFILDS